MFTSVKSKSAIAVAIAHGTLNAAAGIPVMMVNGGSDLVIGVTGLAGFITLILLKSALFIYDVFISAEKIMINRIENCL